MFAACPSFLQMISCDENGNGQLYRVSWEPDKFNFIPIGCIIWNSTQNQIKVNEINYEDDDDDP